MPDPNIISLTIGGDFCPVGRPAAGLLDGSLNAEAIVGSVRPLFAESDIRVVNLECPLTERGSPIRKTGPCIRGCPKTIRLLTCLGINVATLANNHIGDYGETGVLDTIEQCDGMGIRIVGAGRNLEAARRPLYIPVKGRTVALVNVAEQEFGSATAEYAGGNPLDLINLIGDLRQARALADHIVLIVHGGLEFTHCPSPGSLRLLRFLAEEGVTAVIRHHSHYVQGYEIWKGVPIFYGLGNMLFDLGARMDAAWHLGLVVKLNIAPDNTCSVELHPISQNDGEAAVTLIYGKEKAQALRDMDKYGSLLTDEVALSVAWDAVIKKMSIDYFGNLLTPSFTLRRIIRRLRLMRFFHPRMRTTLYWENLLRCDTHRELLIDILEREHNNHK